MSWLSSIGSDVGSFFSNDVLPVLENPVADIGIGAGLLTGGLLLPEALGALGVGAAADAAGAPFDILAAGGLPAAGTSAAGDTLGLTALAGGVPAATSDVLGYAGDVGATSDLSAFLANPIAAAAPDANVADTTLASGLAGNVYTPGAGFPSLSAANAAATPDVWSFPTTDTAPAVWNFPTDTTAAAPAAAAPTSNALDLLTTPAAAGGSATTPAQGGILSSITNALAPVSSTLKTVAPVAGLAGLGYNLYSGYEQKQALNQLASTEQQQAQNQASIAAAATAAAQPEITQGQALQQYLTTGTLPQAFQAQIQQQVAAAKAQIIQGYGARGQNTNPQQNSALAQDLANVDTQAQSLQASLEQTLATAGNQMVSIANQLLASGASATQISTQLPIQVAQLNAELNQQTAQAISSFASAMNSGNLSGKNTVTLQLAS